MFVAFFAWWYGQGWRAVARQMASRLDAISETFSVGTLLRTLFAPWRRIITYAGRGLDAHFQAAVDNAVSRFIGFVIRLMALLAAILLMIGTFIYSLAIIVIWPLIPPLSLGLLIWGLL